MNGHNRPKIADLTKFENIERKQKSFDVIQVDVIEELEKQSSNV